MSASLGRVVVLDENLSVPFDRRVWHEARALSHAGFEVDVVCPQGKEQDREPFELREGVRIHRFPGVSANGSVASYAREYGSALWHMSRLMRKLARERPFDLVHACNPPDFLLLAAWPLKRRGASFLFDHHDLVPELYLSRFGGGKDVLYRLTRLFERLTFRLADVVIATNESYRRVALARGRKRPEDVFVVRSAPDLSRFRAVDPDPALKRGRRYLLVYLGTMGPQDGVDHAVRALAALRRKREDWQAMFVGGGEMLEPMRELAGELGLHDVLEFTGRVPDEDVIRVLSTADVCLAPDPKSPLNDVSTMTKVVEYMAMARPIVSYDLTESTVSAGEAAIYARGDDIDSFAACIDALLDDPERRAAMATEARARIQTLSWSHSERALLAAYERALLKSALSKSAKD
jgi:glycosyltransferase involved in cell wall biosynthesis